MTIDANFIFVQKTANGSKSISAPGITQERSKSDADVFFEKKKIALRKELMELWACSTHSHPDKPVLCWKNPINKLCYLITEGQQNFWVTLVVRSLLDVNILSIWHVLSSRIQINTWLTKNLPKSMFLTINHMDFAQGPILHHQKDRKDHWGLFHPCFHMVIIHHHMPPALLYGFPRRKVHSLVRTQQHLLICTHKSSPARSNTQRLQLGLSSATAIQSVLLMVSSSANMPVNSSKRAIFRFTNLHGPAWRWKSSPNGLV